MKFKSLLLFLWLPICLLAQDDALLQAHTTKIKNAKTYTLELAQKFTEEQFNFKPTEATMTVKEQLVHMAENMYWLSAVYLAEVENPIKGNKPNAHTMDKKAVLEMLNNAYDFVLESMENIDTSSLSKSFKWSNSQMNKYQFLNLIQDHQTHHRGQIIVYGRLNNIIPPKYTGW